MIERIKNFFLLPFLILLLFSFTTFPVEAKRDNCLQISGHVTGINWSSGDLQVACAGDDGPSGCVGGVQSVSPNGNFMLDACTCGAPDSGCLQVGQNLRLETYQDPSYGTIHAVRGNINAAPEGCIIEYGDNALYCGSNTDSKDDANFTVRCEAPATPTPTLPALSSPTPRPTSSPIPTPTPTFGLCGGGITGVCPASSTPTLTVSWNVPSNASCNIFVRTGTQDYQISNQCSGQWSSTTLPNGPAVVNGGSYQLFVSNGTSSCLNRQADSTVVNCAPTSTPVPTTGPGTPTPTVIPTITTGPGTPTLTPRPGTPTPIPPTPTPIFDANACKCDGMEASPIFIGSPATFTAFSKLEGTNNVSRGTQKFIQFFLLKENPANPNDTSTITGPINVNAELIANQSSSTKARYKAQWLFNDTSRLEKNVTYRVFAQTRPGCMQKTTAYDFSSPTRAVLAAEETVQVSFFQKIQAWIAGLLGGFTNNQTQQVTPTPRPTQQPTATPKQGNNLQLLPIYPSEILEKSCQVVRFQIKG